MMSRVDDHVAEAADERSFAAATRVVGDPCRGRACLSSSYRTPLGPFGGYLAAIALRAAARATERAHAVSLACHFLDVGSVGPAVVVAAPLRPSTRTEAVQVAIEQEGRSLLSAVAWFADERRGVDHGPGLPPAAPPPSALATMSELHRDFEGLPALDVRPIYEAPLGHGLADEAPPFDVFALDRLVGGSAGSRLRAWVRLVEPLEGLADAGSADADADADDERERTVVDDARSLAVLDWLAPHLAMARTSKRIALHSTLELHVSFTDRAAGAPWLYGDVSARVARHGVAHAGGEVWAPDGRLLAIGSMQMIQRVRL